MINQWMVLFLKGVYLYNVMNIANLPNPRTTTLLILHICTFLVPHPPASPPPEVTTLPVPDKDHPSKQTLLWSAVSGLFSAHCITKLHFFRYITFSLWIWNLYISQMMTNHEPISNKYIFKKPHMVKNTVCFTVLGQVSEMYKTEWRGKRAKSIEGPR